MAKVIMVFEDVAEDAGLVNTSVTFDPVMESVEKATPAQSMTLKVVKFLEANGHVSDARIVHGNNEVTEV